jgi:hypothetical protein
MALQRSVDEKMMDKCLWNKDIDPRYLIAGPKHVKRRPTRIKTQEDEDKLGG